MFRTMLRSAVLILLALSGPLAAQDVQSAMQDYANFAIYDAGVILPAQIDETAFESLVFIDTRSVSEFTAGTIPGAKNIEWREVFNRTDEIPTDRRVVLFCNTGVFSAQAMFGLRVLEYENVLVLQTGLNGWQDTAAYHPQ